jgi:hypothetical protein
MNILDLQGLDAETQGCGNCFSIISSHITGG